MELKQLIHHFHIDHNGPFLPPQILPNHCLRFLLGPLLYHHHRQLPFTSSRLAIMDLQLFRSSALLTHPL